MTFIFLMMMLQMKHLLVDFLWQPAFEWQNKGTYGHWGGIRHSLKNAIGTSFCFMVMVGFVPALIVLVVDFVVHYHVDWAKMSLNKYMGWTATTHNEFWYLTGLDQFLHQMTYLVLASWFISI